MTYEKRVLKLYLREVIPAVIAFFVVLIIVIKLRPEDGHGGLLEFLPTLPLIFILVAIIRQYRRSDELFKRILLESFALGSLMLGLVLAIWGFGENAGWPELPTIYIAFAFSQFWVLFLPFIIRRYT